MAKRRIDSLLVDKGLAESRAKAQALIMAGEGEVAGKTIIKPGTLVAEEAAITILKLLSRLLLLVVVASNLTMPLTVSSLMSYLRWWLISAHPPVVLPIACSSGGQAGFMP